jgi:hypothetical protein
MGAEHDETVDPVDLGVSDGLAHAGEAEPASIISHLRHALGRVVLWDRMDAIIPVNRVSIRL